MRNQVRKATELFEAERERVIKERQEYNRRQEVGGVGLGSPTASFIGSSSAPALHTYRVVSLRLLLPLPLAASAG